MNLTFESLVDELRKCSLEEKEELKSLLDRWMIEERRKEILGHYDQSHAELREGKLQFTADVRQLKSWLAGP